MEEISKRARASKENGKLGGVRTLEGKTISAQNSFKHGILSSSLTSYDLVEAKDLFHILVKEFEAKSFSDQMLVEQLVICYIKLARCSRFERELLNEALNTEYESDPFDELFSGKNVSIENKALISEEWFMKMDLVLTRYEPLSIFRLGTPPQLQLITPPLG